MRLNKKNISSTPVRLEKHQPERRRNVDGRLMCNGGCCCCSCCLHSLGGLIGAAVVTAKSRPVESRAVKFYWGALALLIGAALVLSWAEGFMTGVILTAVILPFMQLGASLLTLIWIGLRRTDPAGKKADRLVLGKITLWSFLGAVAGILAMVFGFKIFS